MIKKVFLRTFGCQMNVRDSEVLCGLLKKAGYKLIDSPEEADILIFNTCSVRQHAEDKVWSEIGRLAKRGRQIASSLKSAPRNDRDNKPLIGVVGCMAQNYKEKIFERSPQVDFAVGPSDIHKIPEIIKNMSSKSFYEVKIWETEGEMRPEEIYHTGYYEDKLHAFVVISEGCSNYCSYCVVPYVRGKLHNRSHQEIVREIEQAVDKGITSITLLGQNVNAYSDADIDFIKLIGMANKIKGLKEFSFVTSHPKDTSAGLFQAIQECEKLTKCLHLPLQSGSDRILEMMNRRYTRKFYLELVKNYRKIVKAGVLSTDIIVGFPTESEADFRDTYDLVKDVRFDSAYIFKYSVRPHTQAASFMDDVPRAEKEKRHALILELQKAISKSKR